MRETMDERTQLRRLAALMGWAEWVIVTSSESAPMPSLDATTWFDHGGPAGLAIYRDADDEGDLWNPFGDDRDAVELAEHLTRPDSAHGLELARSYEQAWGQGPMGWSALFFDRHTPAEPAHVTDRLDEQGVWAPTFARAVALSALKAFGEA